LLYKGFLDNNRVATPVILTNNIDMNVEGDNLLHTYIVKLDEEIFGHPPLGLTTLGEAMWAEDKWNALAPRMVDETRKHGWSVVQFYEGEPRWRVFSVQQFSDWIRETNEDDKIIRKGIKFVWGDDLGNQWSEEVLFDDPMTYLLKYKEGNGMSTFAFPDLSQAIMTLAFEFRQIKGQLTFTAAKPSYQHFVYGEGADTDAVNDLDSKIKNVDAAAAIGVSEGILKEIRTIENKNLIVLEPAMERQLQLFAGLTRLPVSFYIGEKVRTGMSDMGEKTDILKTNIKKESLFSIFSPFLVEMFNNLYQISIDPELEHEMSLEEVEEATAGNENGQKNQDSDSGREAE